MTSSAPRAASSQLAAATVAAAVLLLARHRRYRHRRFAPCIFCDLDGTLLDGSCRLTADTVAALA
eukprot:3297841-Prymnesium_polylepis.1